MKNYKLTFVSIFALLLSLFVSPMSAHAQATPGFLGGDIMEGTNNTIGNGSWSDPVSAVSGNVIEFNIIVQNQVPDSTARNAKVTCSLPSGITSTLTVSCTVSADNTASMTDTTTVNITDGLTQGIQYTPGHVRVIDAACSSACTVGDTVLTSGVPVGDLGPGQSAQVFFKAALTNYAAATPTPSVTPTPTPTPTAAAVAATQAQAQAQGQSQSTNVTNNITNTSTSNPTQTVNQTQTVAAGAAHVGGAKAPVVVSNTNTPVKELPKTGLPLAALPLLGLVPAGLKFRKFGSTNTGDLSESPLSLWEKRQTFKS